MKWTKTFMVAVPHPVIDGRQVLAVTSHYVNEEGDEEEITILRGFYANDNYDLSDFGLATSVTPVPPTEERFLEITNKVYEEEYDEFMNGFRQAVKEINKINDINKEAVKPS